MPVDPFLVPLLASLPPTPDHVDHWESHRATSARDGDALIRQVTEPGPEVDEVRTVSLPVPGGEIDLVVHRPWPGTLPVHLFLHGGGFVEGSAHDRYVDIVCRERAVGASCVVVAVDYRKAPEHPYPTALQDTAAAFDWIVDHAGDLGVRPDLVTLGGQSAGANLAAAFALQRRDAGGVQPAFQVLEVPPLDLTDGLPSRVENGEGYGLTLADLERLGRLYLGPDGSPTDPYVSPLLADSLAGVAPAHVLSAEYDPLRDDGGRYVERLREAGVDATFSLQRGQIHISAALTAVLPAARAWRDEVVDVLRRVNARGVARRPAGVPTCGTSGGGAVVPTVS